MAPASTWIALGLQTLTFVGLGAVGFSRIMSRLAVLESRAVDRDKQASQMIELDRSRAYAAAREFCRNDCPRKGQGGTNPAIPIYPAPDGI